MYPPEVKDYSLDVIANTSDSKVLYCKFFGNPIPTISWDYQIAHTEQFDSATIESSEVISRLIISSLTYKDSGAVSCSAKSLLGEAKAEGTLDVHGTYSKYLRHCHEKSIYCPKETEKL